MKRFLVFLFAFLMIFSQQAFCATYNISPKGPATPTLDTCEPPPYSTTVSPYAKQGTCNAQQQPSNTYGNQQYGQYSQQQAQPQIQPGMYYDQNRQFSGQANTLADLPPGTIVMDPKSVWNFRLHRNYTGDILASHPVFWRKLEDNHYSQGATLLISVPNVASYPFCHSQKGLRAWDESDVRRFLRTTFYNHLSNEFKNSIVNVNIPFADMQGKPKTVTDNFFLLSIVEWGLSDRKNNGNVIKYNDLPNIYGGNGIMHYSDNVYYMGERDFSYNWTRTINRPAAKSAGYDNDVFIISNKGVLDTYYSSMDSYHVRPAVNIKSTTRVSGPYNFVYNANQSSLIYYILEF